MRSLVGNSGRGLMLVLATSVTSVWLGTTVAHADSACSELARLASLWEQQAYQLAATGERQNAMAGGFGSNVNKNIMWGSAARSHMQSAELMRRSTEANQYVRAGNCRDYLLAVQQQAQQQDREAAVKSSAKQWLLSYYRQTGQIPPPNAANVSAIAAQIGAEPNDYPAIHRVLAASYSDFDVHRKADNVMNNVQRMLQGMSPY